jgi:trehalose 2-sulfotransferase
MHPGARELIANFANTHSDLEFFETAMLAPEADCKYLIFFTPRSGSSWLTELLSTHHGFGLPDEWFNPDLIPPVAQRLRVNNLFDYISLLKRQMIDPASLVFGAELTYFQLEVMRQLVDFFVHFPMKDTRIFYLSRRDIILQSISLFRSVKSGIFHSRAYSDHLTTPVGYDADEIEYWLEHIIQQENGLEHLFSDNGVSPVRLYYEDMISDTPRHTLNQFSCELFGADFLGEVIAPVENKKISFEGSGSWAKQFARDRPQLCKDIHRRRSIVSIGEP